MPELLLQTVVQILAIMAIYGKSPPESHIIQSGAAGGF